jgi:hypothetical protein
VQGVDGIRSGAAVDAGVQFAPPCGQAQLRADRPPQAGGDRGPAPVDHSDVEDQRRREPVLDRCEVVKHRMADDLLLAVGQHAHVHAQLARGGQVERGPQDGVEVALVVGDPAAVEPAVADRGLERRALPQVERADGLHVVVAVGDHGGRPGDRGGDNPIDERIAVLLGDGRAADQVGDPVRRRAQLALVRPVARHRLDA